MKAIVQTGYGAPEDVLQFREIDAPVVADDEVLVAVRAASVHPDVWHVVTGRPWVVRLMGAGLRKPKVPVPGTDLAGVVEAVGRSVSRFRPGDEVFGESHSRMQWCNGGAYAEYAAVPQDTLALKPAGTTFEEAASVPTAGYIALINLPAEGEWASRQNVLINGAGGGVGSIALQVAKARGATVTGVDRAEKLELLRALGADRVIDFAREDFTLGDERYDLIFDVASTLSLKGCKRVLNPTGTYVLIGHDHFGDAGGRTFGSLPHFFKLQARAPFDRHLPALSFSIPEKSGVMARLKELLETGQLTPVIDRTFPLHEVPEAMRYLQQGGGPGRIIITPWARRS
ncbi:MAG: NAD(P)-dependent alcohol dehydrogenase [bacterium]